jgi:S1-C subfamily serine protease
MPVRPLTQITDALERAGFLLPCGMAPNVPPFMAQTYMTQGGASPGQVGGNLWLSQIFGADLIIPSYNTVTVQISGTDDAGNPRWGSGLVLDHTHIVTNKHVVAALAPGSPLAVTPSSGLDVGDQFTCQLVAHAHPELDVALIEIRPPTGQSGMTRLAGMAFRDPSWADDVYLFGYPHVPMLAGMVITVQRGEVVNPAAETPASGGLPRQKTFLYSAIARPGNSGGPIVAHDGRVIGLVVEDSLVGTQAHAAGYEPPPPTTPEERIRRLEREVEELTGKVHAPSFYHGIPSSEVIRALDDLGFGGLAAIDGPQP